MLSFCTHDYLHLPQLLCQSSLPKLPGVQESLFRQIDTLHIGRIRRRRTADPRSNQDGIGFENDSIVDDFVDGQGEEVVVFHNCALIRCSSAFKSITAKKKRPLY